MILRTLQRWIGCGIFEGSYDGSWGGSCDGLERIFQWFLPRSTRRFLWRVGNRILNRFCDGSRDGCWDGSRDRSEGGFCDCSGNDSFQCSCGGSCRNLRWILAVESDRMFGCLNLRVLFVMTPVRFFLLTGHKNEFATDLATLLRRLLRWVVVGTQNGP